MNAHTPGRLAAAVDGTGFWWYVHDSADRVLAKNISDYDARRLAACWNAFDGVPTDKVEKLMADLILERDIAKQELAGARALAQQQDTMLGKRPCQNGRCNELNSVRALLREVVADTGIVAHMDAVERSKSYLAIADTLDGAPIPAPTIPAGWALNSADFSIIAGGGNTPGNVTLVRHGEDRVNWIKHADAGVIDLYAYGRGATLDLALADAIKQALAAAPVPKEAT